MLGVCVQATEQQGFTKASARKYADDRACSQGQVAEKEKVGVDEGGGGESLKGQNNLQKFLSERSPD